MPVHNQTHAAFISRELVRPAACSFLELEGVTLQGGGTFPICSSPKMWVIFSTGWAEHLKGSGRLQSRCRHDCTPLKTGDTLLIAKAGGKAKEVTV